MRMNALEIEGLEDLKLALRKLPMELVSEASAIVTAHAIETARQIQAAYPTGPTGNLKAHVSMDVETSAVHAAARVRSTAKHAWIFEYGTVQRHWKNGKNTGRMPSSHTLVGIAIRRRELMKFALIQLVERAGFTVTGR